MYTHIGIYASTWACVSATACPCIPTCTSMHGKHSCCSFSFFRTHHKCFQRGQTHIYICDKHIVLLSAHHHTAKLHAFTVHQQACLHCPPERTPSHGTAGHVMPKTGARAPVVLPCESTFFRTSWLADHCTTSCRPCPFLAPPTTHISCKLFSPCASPAPGLTLHPADRHPEAYGTAEGPQPAFHLPVEHEDRHSDVRRRGEEGAVCVWSEKRRRTPRGTRDP